MKWLPLLFCLCRVSDAATITAASASRADVGTALALTSDGDTLSIPAGSGTWTSVLTITNAITLQGAGIGQTLIGDGMASANPVLVWNMVTNKAHRMTGIDWRDGGRSSDTNNQAFNGIFQINGFAGSSDTTTFRADHNSFSNLFGSMFQFANVIGVADHFQYRGLPTARFCTFYNPAWNGGVYGDKSFTDGNHFGTDRFFFIEDSGFYYPSNNYAFIDAWDGARFVFRFNHVTNGWVEAHGTDSGNRLRGTRAYELYGNFFIGNDLNAYVANCRSGTSLIFSNPISGYTGSPRFELAIYRVNTGTWVPWGQADGSNQWDTNNAGVLIAALDQPGRSGGSLITGDTPSLPWTAGQNNQVDDPCYEWSNSVHFVAGHPTIRAGEHYFNDTVKPGYTPYTYPHPLVGNSTANIVTANVGALILR